MSAAYITAEMEEAAKEAERLYGDILHVPHHVSRNHTPAPRTSRAAQFSPFAALTGYDAAIAETARLTETKPQLSEEQKQQLDRTAHEALSHRQRVLITYFKSDELKEGGSFETKETAIRRIMNGCLEAEDRQKIMLEDIIDLIQI